MKKLISWAIVAFLFMQICWAAPAFAGDAASGAKIFSARCASCHAGGKNIVNAQKTLSKVDLEKYDMFDLEKIKTQVTNGKGAMPSFKALLKPEQIEDVATYVLDSAEKGWKK
ncbi:cytochrome c6 PetJ [Gloeothece verrucosa]|uniref:Cytochrome c6 n=1 Tax=Gloeothece verrucosa (strain PCC 7822) TaxID=497965 RepID=E0U7V8_GLOV7|nr:c-type cytochrome [Gloeothece verrucosa]ADN16045.1 cytochrome c class I [Gloeothece verrucosa PCC 7822]